MRDGLESCRGSQTADQTFPDNASISDLESELQTDQSVLGSPFDHSTGTNKGKITFVTHHLVPLFFLNSTAAVFVNILFFADLLFWDV